MNTKKAGLLAFVAVAMLATIAYAGGNDGRPGPGRHGDGLPIARRSYKIPVQALPSNGLLVPTGDHPDWPQEFQIRCMGRPNQAPASW